MLHTDAMPINGPVAILDDEQVWGNPSDGGF